MKIWKNYAVTAVLCLAVTLCAVFTCIADENSQKIIYDRDAAVLVLGSGDNAVTQGATDISGTVEKCLSAIKTAAGFAPPPISCVYWLIANLADFI